MRISGKQVRYTMELLAGAFDESFRRELYVIFAEVQEMLGTINDHASAVTMFHEWRERADNNGSQAALHTDKNDARRTVRSLARRLLRKSFP